VGIDRGANIAHHLLDDRGLEHLDGIVEGELAADHHQVGGDEDREPVDLTLDQHLVDEAFQHPQQRAGDERAHQHQGEREKRD